MKEKDILYQSVLLTFAAFVGGIAGSVYNYYDEKGNTLFLALGIIIIFIGTYTGLRYFEWIRQKSKKQ